MQIDINGGKTNVNNLLAAVEYSMFECLCN